MSLGPGTRLGPYEIQSALGAGGMGEVYRARDTRLGRDVAVKVLPATASTDPERLRRFEQEARAAAALSHPNILAVYDIGRHPSTGSGQAVPYIVSELLSGSSLRERIGQTGGGARSSSGSGAPSLGERAEPAEERDGLSVRRASCAAFLARSVGLSSFAGALMRSRASAVARANASPRRTPSRSRTATSSPRISSSPATAA